ncbi:Alpha/Beta hydrolase fold [Phytophthora cactorum]|nr:Alpha/Beta hydrolase fold [Phytophthora cactorum]
MDSVPGAAEKAAALVKGGARKLQRSEVIPLTRGSPQMPSPAISPLPRAKTTTMKLSSTCTMILGPLLLLSASLSNVVNAQCSDVHIVFARGSGEMPGLGICGEPLVSGITSNLGGMSVSSYAVSYLASYDQTSAGPGATDMTNHVVSVAQECPNTVFVLGGYSQGGSVTDISIGIQTMLGSGEAIPETLAPRIKAIVTFGNPLKLMGQTIEAPARPMAPRLLSSAIRAIQCVVLVST